MQDNFEDPRFDPLMWHRATDGTGWDFAEREGRLEIGIAADSVLGGPWNVVEGHYGTQCKLLGNLDVQTGFTHQPIRIAFDNFSAEAEGVDCPSGATPARKPSP